MLGIALLALRAKFQSESKWIICAQKPFCLQEDFDFIIPKIGEKKAILDFAQKQLQHYIQSQKWKNPTPTLENEEAILLQMQKDLDLPSIPRHIECFDNSNLLGENAVSACVVFENAMPAKAKYRSFDVQTITGPDDFGTMKEVVFRRYSGLLKKGEDLPDLILIDGGKGQLNAALESLQQLDLADKIPIISIAKRLEEIFFPHQKESLILDRKSSTLHLLQQLRDEAHRFGIYHHRKKRSKNALRSPLEEIVGLGEVGRNKLLDHFKTLQNIQNASVQSLEKVLGNKKQAAVVFDYFQRSSTAS